MTYQQSSLVDDYIAQFPEPIRERLTKVRRAIQATFPKTIEDISYGIPTYRPAPGKRGIVHFGGAKSHIALYGIIESQKDHVSHALIAPHRSGKGTLQFPHDAPLPMVTIRKILAYHAGKFDS